jgi:hypothetical protein
MPIMDPPPDPGPYPIDLGYIPNQITDDGRMKCGTCDATLTIDDLGAYKGLGSTFRCAACRETDEKRKQKNQEDLDRIAAMLEDDDEEGDD